MDAFDLAEVLNFTSIKSREAKRSQTRAHVHFNIHIKESERPCTAQSSRLLYIKV